MDQTYEEMQERLVRIESKLSALMQALGYDRNGTPIRKQTAHPESLFTSRKSYDHRDYFTR